jgi:hypothetical protein
MALTSPDPVSSLIGPSSPLAVTVLDRAQHGRVDRALDGRVDGHDRRVRELAHDRDVAARAAVDGQLAHRTRDDLVVGALDGADRPARDLDGRDRGEEHGEHAADQQRRAALSAGGHL